MILDIEIERLCKGGKKLIRPFDPAGLSGCTYDLRVGQLLSSRKRLDRCNLKKGPYFVDSGESVTITTLETINLRDHVLFGIIANKHSIVAEGLFHPITTVDHGFYGPLALTFFNGGNTRFEMRFGTAIAKIFFIELVSKPHRVYGDNQKPTFAQGSIDVALVPEPVRKRRTHKSKE